MTNYTVATIIIIVGAAFAQLGCSKPATQQLNADQTNAESIKTEPTKTERIAAIDAILSAPPTGRPGDADNRASLRAERAGLTGSVSSRAIQSPPVRVPVNPQQTAPPQIIVAHNSQATSDKEWEATKAAVDQRSQKMQELNGKHWHPGMREGGHYISQREFEQSVNRDAEKLTQPQN